MIASFTCITEYKQNVDWNDTFRDIFETFNTDNITTSFVEQHPLYKVLVTYNAKQSSDRMKQLAGSCAAKFILSNLKLTNLQKRVKAIEKVVVATVTRVKVLEGQVEVMGGQMAAVLKTFQKESSRKKRGSPGAGGSKSPGICVVALYSLCTNFY